MVSVDLELEECLLKLVHSSIERRILPVVLMQCGAEAAHHGNEVLEPLGEGLVRLVKREHPPSSLPAGGAARLCSEGRAHAVTEPRLRRGMLGI